MTNEISAGKSDENSTDWDPYSLKTTLKEFVLQYVTSTPRQIVKAMETGKKRFWHILLDKSGIIDQLNCQDILH